MPPLRYSLCHPMARGQLFRGLAQSRARHSKTVQRLNSCKSKCLEPTTRMLGHMSSRPCVRLKLKGLPTDVSEKLYLGSTRSSMKKFLQPCSSEDVILPAFQEASAHQRFLEHEEGGAASENLAIPSAVTFTMPLCNRFKFC